MPDNAKAVEQPSIVPPPTGCPPWEHDVSLCGRYVPTTTQRASEPSQAATEAHGDDKRATIAQVEAAMEALECEQDCDETAALDGRTVSRGARRGTVCRHCWLFWRQQPGHDPAACRGGWEDADGISTVCMCNCRDKENQVAEINEQPAADTSRRSRVRKYRAAIAAARMRGEVSGDRTEMARAAIELADAEQAELQGRIDRWQERCLEAQRERDRLRKERDRSFMKYRAEKAEAKVARVEALVEQWVREAQARLAEVAKLHHRDKYDHCEACEVWWPCPTGQILEGATLAEVVAAFEAGSAPTV